jgi:transposase
VSDKLGAQPKSAEEWQDLIRRIQEEHEQKLRGLSASLEKERAEKIEYQNEALKHFEEIQLLRRRIFGRRAEKLSEEDRRQLLLFNEAEEIFLAQGSAQPPDEQTVEVRAHSRRKSGRKPLPSEILRIVTLHDISDAEKRCACGQEMVRIREESCEKLEVIPARIRVRRHVRPKYTCHACEGSGDEDRAAVRIAPPPVQLLPKSIASPALVVYVVVGKFCDSLPFYRQEKQFARIGVDISRQDIANWSIAVFQRLRPLRELLRGEIRQGPLVQIDETTVQVMGEPGRPNTSKSFMWVFLGGTPGQPVVEFQYHPTRAGKIPAEVLRDYKGFIQTYGYEGYQELGSQPGIVHVGCWARARRKFFEAREVSKNKGSADVALSGIDSLFKMERTLRDQDLTPEQFTQRRREQVELVLEKLHVWLEEREGQMPPSTALGKAIGYAVGQWPKLIRYLESPLLSPDNNACERAIRPFVVGRKNWLLSGCPASAEASAAWYSLIETAKLNGIEPYLYLCYVLSRLPDGEDPAEYRSLLPWSIPKESLLDFESGRLA